jgi:predicted esterase
MMLAMSKNALVLLLASALLIGACSDDNTSPGAEAGVDAAADAAADTRTDVGDGPSLSDAAADAAEADSSPPSPDSGVDSLQPDQGAPVDIGVTYTGTFPPTPTVGFTNVTLTVDGVARPMTIYRPTTLKPNSPLIVACPSTDGSAEDGIWDIAANELADAEGMYIVSVEPLKQSQGDWDQHEANETYFQTYPNVSFATNNDLKAVAAAIAEAKRAYGIDPKRVFTGGYSNGAFFAQFAAMLLPDRIAGFASAGGGLVRCKTTFDCIFNGTGAPKADCATLATRPGWCSCSGAEKPQTIPTLPASAFKPAGYIGHAINDDVVSVYYACQLADRMTTLGYPNKLALTLTGGHNAKPHFMVDAWAYLKAFKLP